MIDDIYSAQILSLAANMPGAGRLPYPQGTAQKIAKLCGSKVTVDVTLDAQGRVAQFAQDVQACALGQASAAVLGAHIAGADLAEIEKARQGLRSMLKDGASPPDGRFSDLAMLEPVKAYPARHASTMLAFEAAAEAVRQASARTRTAGAA